MRLKIFFLSLFLILIPALASADQSARVTIHNIDMESRNLVISFPKETQKWLLHYKKGCVGLRNDSESVELIVTGSLNASGDRLKLGEYDQCEVDQAEEINAVFTVDSTYPSEVESIVTNDKAGRFSVQHPQSCRAIRNFLHQKIYADLSDKTIQKGDKLYFPAKAGLCVVGFSQPVKEAVQVEKPKDYTAPGVISDLKATPVDRAAELSWRIARDVENVDYYWVSYSRSPIKTKDMKISEMPNLEKATTHFYTVKGLDNDEAYYFYVIAVDRQGRPASDWSNSAKAIPTGSAFRTQESSSQSIRLDFRVKEESDQRIVFEWNLIPKATRYLVVLEMNGRRDWILQGVRTTAYVNRTPMRQGKDLRLIVRALNRYGILDEVYYNFKF